MFNKHVSKYNWNLPVGVCDAGEKHLLKVVCGQFHVNCIYGEFHPGRDLTPIELEFFFFCSETNKFVDLKKKL